MVNKGVTPPNYSTTVGQTRALLGDTDSVPLNPVESGFGEFMWYSDDELTGLLTVYSDNPRRAAAQALRTVASSQALLLKKWSADDLAVDGPAIARALRDLARDMDDQADNEAAAKDIFELVPMAGAHKRIHPELEALDWNDWSPPSTPDDPDDWFVNGEGYIVDND